MISQYWLLLVLVPLALYGLRAYIKAVVTKSVEHAYDIRLEALKGEIRQSEERLKSDLRTNEAELSALRDGAMSGRARRVAIVDKRRLEASDRLWVEAMNLFPLKALASTIGMIKFEAAAKEAAKNAEFREFFKTIGTDALKIERPGQAGDCERPFVSPLSWALFSAYRTILVHAWGKLKLLTVGVPDPENMFTYEPMRKMLTQALPHRSDFIATVQPEQFHVLIEELEAALLSELRLTLDGEEDDRQSIQRAADITKAAIEAAESLKARSKLPAGLEG
jgi:hypothetical protein